jgi:hypothetical protein
MNLEYITRVKDRLEKFDESLRARKLEQIHDEKVVCDDLTEAGFDVLLIIDMTWKYSDYSAAFPVIMRHLNKKDCYDRGLEDLGRLMAHQSAFPLWRDLLTLYNSADKATQNGMLGGLAIALSEHYMRSKLPELRIELIKSLRDQSRGESRILLLDCFRRKRDEESMNLVDELSTDPDLKIEIASWKRKPR